MTGHVNDHKLAALQSLLSISGGNIDDLEAAWLISESSTFDHINNMWLELFQGHGASADQYNTAAHEFLTGMGYSGALNDMWHDYWFAGGGLPGGPWEYATLAAAESSGDPWVNGDQVTITGGAVFCYISAIAVSGYSGLIHKYPYDGIGTAGTLSASTVVDSQNENVDPDTWGWTDNGIGVKGVDYDYDTSGGYARFRDLTSGVGFASLKSPNVGSSEAELFIIMDSVNVITTGTANKARLWNSNYVDASNARYTNLTAKLIAGTNWELAHTTPVTWADTGKAYTGTYRIFWYQKNGQWAVWFDDEGTAPTISGTVPIAIALPRPYFDDIVGDAGGGGITDFILGRHVIGGMTTA